MGFALAFENDSFSTSNKFKCTRTFCYLSDFIVWKMLKRKFNFNHSFFLIKIISSLWKKFTRQHFYFVLFLDRILIICIRFVVEIWDIIQYILRLFILKVFDIKTWWSWKCEISLMQKSAPKMVIWRSLFWFNVYTWTPLRMCLHLALFQCDTHFIVHFKIQQKLYTKQNKTKNYHD